MHLHRPLISVKKVLLSAVLAATLSLGMAPAALVYAAENTPAVVGAFPAPPRGNGAGKLVKWSLDSNKPLIGQFGAPKTPSGNSFYIAYDNSTNRLYVPTVAGITYILDAKTLAPLSSFATIAGGRVARVSPDGKSLLVLSGMELAIYSLANNKQLFTAPVGGNALAISNDARFVYVGGNMSKNVTEVSLESAKITRTFPIFGSGDLVMANSKLFSANIKTGVMSVLDPATSKIVNITTDEVDPAFSYRKIGAASAGFMQIDASPDQKYVYAVGFSGNILKFATSDASYVGKISIKAAPTGPNKLSGFTLVNNGTQAVVTIENRKETALVRMSDGKILKFLAGTASNRWVSLGS
ncbi:hypothetical protein MNBD_ALPHA12-1638 [hydrothermal vent metagenome]|uniref:Uncharacterized protein n=1 Tax=hydrothermal vent metagenome TaxID=652676 RepID=A0A3B0TSK5_9ZZZZ